MLAAMAAIAALLLAAGASADGGEGTTTQLRAENTALRARLAKALLELEQETTLLAAQKRQYIEKEQGTAGKTDAGGLTRRAWTDSTGHA